MLEVYRNLTTSTNCSKSPLGELECLRSLPFDTLNSALNITNTWISGTGLGPFIAVIDGDILQSKASTHIATGAFVKVPILYGTNFDEGTAIAPSGINSDAEFAAKIAKGGPDNVTISTIQILYPNINAIGIPATYNPPPYETGYGMQWKRAAAFWGDIVEHAPRRAVTKAWARENVTSYCYHFNVKPVGNDDAIGVTHFSEVA
jgi:carboxylesterase type B